MPQLTLRPPRARPRNNRPHSFATTCCYSFSIAANVRNMVSTLRGSAADAFMTHLSSRRQSFFLLLP
jgi:hypothetical protein